MKDGKSVNKRRRLLLDALHTFESAARNGNFADAAAEMSVTGSAVSHQIRRLEEHLGLALFDRTGKYPVLTHAGQQLACNLEPLFGQLHGAVDDLKRSAQVHLSVSAMSALGANWLARRAMAFANQNKDLQLRISTTDELVDLYAGNIDVGIRFGAGVYPGLVSELLTTTEAFPVCSPSFLAANRALLRDPESLAGSILINDESSSKNAALPSWRAWLQAAGVSCSDLRFAMTFQDPRLAQEAAVAGHGFCMGISCLVSDDIADGKLVAPFDLKLASPFSFWIVSSVARAESPKVIRFKEWLKRQMSREHSLHGR
ncbi:LysR substrate-binding domain-containing protein [Variovorax sp. PBS-H4]|uniref:LysR substrate-binding domain-containing protein n=1 Tax=Variovorax sp. PBS-H4 TaxID=434008 RepID=UPI0013A534BB|nr:LysR substrate-binding domain-containing protein [Variovorax sp. PBS-H4]